MPKPHSNPFRSFLKQYLFELLSDMFLEWLEVREHAWTSQRCPHCHKPYAYQDAQYCAFCGMPLTVTEPALCAVPTTDPLHLPPGTLARAVHREAATGVGPHTQITRAISKIHLQPQAQAQQAQAKELPTK